MRITGTLLLCALLLGTAGARAADLTPTGALARWLDGSAGPALAEALARHPRLTGETVGFTAIEGGVPMPGSDRLHDAVERALRRQLLRAEGVRLALPAGDDACSAAARPGLLVGIEIVTRSGRATSVSLGVVDVAEGVWVGGVAHDWRGTLTAEEARALATPSNGAGATRAVALADADAVAAALQARLRCALPSGLDGDVHLAADTPEGERVAAALRGRLGRSAGLRLVPDPEADWRLRVLVDETSATPEVRVVLGDVAAGPAQALAAVAIVPTRLAAAPIPREPEIRVRGSVVPAVLPAPQALLETPRLAQVQRAGVCQRASRDRLCAELAVDLTERAYVVVLSTHEGRVRPVGCTSRLERSDPGERRYRFAVGRADAGRPDTGVYVFAVRDRALARRLAEVVQDAPGACGTRSGRPLDHWFEDLAALLAQHPEAIEWHAVHLVRDADRVIRI